jgi:hypothetical protein
VWLCQGRERQEWGDRAREGGGRVLGRVGWVEKMGKERQGRGRVGERRVI